MYYWKSFIGNSSPTHKVCGNVTEDESEPPSTTGLEEADFEVQLNVDFTAMLLGAGIPIETVGPMGIMKLKGLVPIIRLKITNSWYTSRDYWV